MGADTSNDTLLEQIFKISEMGTVNIMNPATVKKAALKSGFHELAQFIEADPNAYKIYIRTGELP